MSGMDTIAGNKDIVKEYLKQNSAKVEIDEM